jgi:hypothetical protein
MQVRGEHDPVLSIVQHWCALCGVELSLVLVFSKDEQFLDHSIIFSNIHSLLFLL